MLSVIGLSMITTCGNLRTIPLRREALPNMDDLVEIMEHPFHVDRGWKKFEGYPSVVLRTNSLKAKPNAYASFVRMTNNYPEFDAIRGTVLIFTGGPSAAREMLDQVIAGAILRSD